MNKFLSLSFVLSTLDIVSGEYNYDEYGANWTDTCSTGTEQSPIDLTLEGEFVSKSDTKMKFEGYDYKDYAVGATLSRKDHTVKMDLDSGELRVVFPVGDGA